MRWRDAMTHALYGETGFFTGPESGGPAAHFRTSVTASRLFAKATARLFSEVDVALGQPDRLDLVDIGAGRGELLTGVLAALPADLAARTSPLAVELAGRPAELPAAIGWADQAPHGITGLVVATEWLDNVPLDVAVAATDGPRYLLVDQEGSERPGDRVSAADAAWLARWWPVSQPGRRAEIGLPRDQAWAATVATLTAGLAVAVDYGHFTGNRPVLGSVTGFRDGREVPPIPDGSCDITAHVAWDAVAAAGEAVAGQPSVVCEQRTALRALGISGARPPLSLATTNPQEYVRGLTEASEAQELTAQEGLGGHHWLAQPVNVQLRLPWATPPV